MPLTLPITQHRFRISETSDAVQLNTQSIDVDMVNKEIRVKVRATVDPKDWQAAVRFSHTAYFEIDILDGASVPYFKLSPTHLRLKDYSFNFDYGIAKPVVHDITWTFNELHTKARELEGKPVPQDPSFPDPSTAMETLTTQQNSSKEA